LSISIVENFQPGSAFWQIDGSIYLTKAELEAAKGSSLEYFYSQGN